MDTVTAQSYTTNYNIGDLTALLGSDYAYIGFSSADGGVASVQTVSDFAYQSGSNNFTPAVVTNLPATAIQPTAATLAGQVLTSGGFAPTITIYYGDTDSGTNAGNWANSITLGVEIGTFSQAVSGLSPNTTYYYTAAAANFAGISWASPSLSFDYHHGDAAASGQCAGDGHRRQPGDAQRAGAFDGGPGASGHGLLRDQ